MPESAPDGVRTVTARPQKSARARHALEHRVAPALGMLVPQRLEPVQERGRHRLARRPHTLDGERRRGRRELGWKFVRVLRHVDADADHDRVAGTAAPAALAQNAGQLCVRRSAGRSAT